MMKENSLYQCPICKREVESTPGIRIGCANCNQPMDEVRKGIMKKVSVEQSEQSSNTLSEPVILPKKKNVIVQKQRGRKKSAK
jgi:protein-arginine kinase activator protein McsA